MRRRGFLVSAGLALVAGCLGGDGGEETTTTTTTETTTATTTTTTTATTTTTVSDVESRLEIGDWYSTENHSVVVDRVRTTRTLNDVVNRRTVSMPEGETLVIVDIRMKNISDDPQLALPGHEFGVVAGDRVFEAVDAFLHSGVGEEFELGWLAYANERKRLPLDGGEFTLEPGGFRTLWFGAPVPTGLLEERRGAAFDDRGGPTFEVWWVAGMG